MKKVSNVIITIIILVMLVTACNNVQIDVGTRPELSPSAGEQKPDEQLQKFLIPVIIYDMNNVSAAEDMENLVDNSELYKQKVTKHQVNDDGSLTLWVTEEQRLYWINDAKNFFEEYQTKWSEQGYKIDISDDFNTVTFYSSPKMDPFLFSESVMVVNAEIAVQKIFTGTLPEDLTWNMKVINQDNGKLLVDVQRPQENWSIDHEDWE